MSKAKFIGNLQNCPFILNFLQKIFEFCNFRWTSGIHRLFSDVKLIL